MELCSILYGSLDGKGIWKKMDTLCMAESLCCSSETITTLLISYQFSSVQSLSRVRLCNPMNCSMPGLPVHHQLLEFTQTQYIESVMPSSLLILCRPLLLLPPIPPSIIVFSNESTLRIRWPKYWSFSFSIIPSICRASILLSVMVTSFRIPTKTVQGFQFLHILASTCCLFIIAVLADVR